MKAFLAGNEIIDYDNPEVMKLSSALAKGCLDDISVAKKCFEFVRDKIRHSGDHKDAKTTCKASEVLAYGGGWCYAKSHLLAALLRANGIPTGFCYQRLSCSEYEEDVFCLHGLNAIYLREFGWYKVDARGNKDGVDAQFDPPRVQLAFHLQAHEFDLESIYAEPLPEVIKALTTHLSYEEMVHNFPDIDTP